MECSGLVYSLGAFSFVLSPPPPPQKSLLKIAFVLHLGQSFQLQMLLEAGELVLWQQS